MDFTWRKEYLTSFVTGFGWLSKLWPISKITSRSLPLGGANKLGIMWKWYMTHVKGPLTWVACNTNPFAWELYGRRDLYSPLCRFTSCNGNLYPKLESISLAGESLKIFVAIHTNNFTLHQEVPQLCDTPYLILSWICFFALLHVWRKIRCKENITTRIQENMDKRYVQN